MATAGSSGGGSRAHAVDGAPAPSACAAVARTVAAAKFTGRSIYRGARLVSQGLNAAQMSQTEPRLGDLTGLLQRRSRSNYPPDAPGLPVTLSRGATPSAARTRVSGGAGVGTRLAEQCGVPSKRILLIDDEWDNLECVQEFLQGEFDVTAACGGAAGLECLFDEQFDAVMLDVTMPEVDGFEVMRVVQRVMPELPVILASAVPHLGRIAAEVGATDWIAKPFRFSDLRDRLSALTNRVGSNVAAPVAHSG